MNTVIPVASVKARQPKPEWLRVKAPGSENYVRLRALMRGLKLNTVCEEAHCPNIGECWGDATATFMILGDVLHESLRLLCRRPRSPCPA